jgi:hypothetical protein
MKKHRGSTIPNMATPATIAAVRHPWAAISRARMGTRIAGPREDIEWYDDMAKARRRWNQWFINAERELEKARSLPRVIMARYIRPKVQMLSAWDSSKNPVPESVVPMKRTGFGPKRSMSHPAMGPTGPPSDLDKEKTREMAARLTPNPSLTGSRNTTKPLL